MNLAPRAHTSQRTLRLVDSLSTARTTKSATTDESAIFVPAVPIAEGTTGLQEISPSDPEWDHLELFVKENSAAYTQHYRCRMKLVKVWRVLPNHVLESNQQKAAKLGKATKLFHGTSPGALQSILQDGFRLPESGGMFGRGVYFAECPLKSAQYSRIPSKNSIVKFLLGCFAGCLVGGHVCCLGSCVGGFMGAGLAYRYGHITQMLVCDVHLGKRQTLRAAKQVTSEDLKAGWFSSLFGAADYDSVYAPGGFRGAVEVPEYIVYHPYQATPRFVIEFTTLPA